MGKKKIIAVLDTEATPIVPMGDDVDPLKMRVYDVGYIIKDKRSPHVYAERSFVCGDVMFDPRDYMRSAYYADKLPKYRAAYNDGGEWAIHSFRDVYQTFRADCREYGITEVWAFNCRFDALALDATIRDNSNGYIKYFTPYGVKWLDLWRLVGETITKTARYNEWCDEHGFYSDAGIARTNVETVTAYLTGDIDFSERHTALDDARHEAAIMDYLRHRHYTTPDKWGDGWRSAGDYAKKTGHYIPKSKRPKSKKK